MTQEELIEEVKTSGLRGRGGAAFPTGVKWGFLQGSNRPNKYVLVNCEEGDPGAYNDKGLVESDPHTVVEGTIIAGYATGSNYGYIFLRHGHIGPTRRAQDAIKQAYEHGLLGQNILGTDFSFDMEVAFTGDSYVAGEETALMEAIEGKRAMPRARPPFPAQSGVWENPSNINNVKTVSYAPEIVRRGGEWFAEIGYERSKGTAILCLTGDVNYPGMYEVPFGLTLGQVVNEIAGGTASGRDVKLLQTGGPLGGVLGRDGLEIMLDYEGMSAAGAILGSGGIIVGADDICAVDLARTLVAFCQFESCGKCFPCRLGMTHLVEMLERIAANNGRPEDLDLMSSTGKTMAIGSLCGHGQLGFNPISSALKFFEEDFRVHLEEGRCPTGSCDGAFYRPTRTRPLATAEWYAKEEHVAP
jgi:NADH:ubiquinone oxidoreductase subunit F (NADH-binding)